MHEYKIPLGDAIRNARKNRKLTQAVIAERAGVDVRTIIAIENYKGNPKMEVMYPLVRALEMDANLIYYQNPSPDSRPALNRLNALISDCTEQEADALYTIIESILSVMHSDKTIHIK